MRLAAQAWVDDVGARQASARSVAREAANGQSTWSVNTRLLLKVRRSSEGEFNGLESAQEESRILTLQPPLLGISVS